MVFYSSKSVDWKHFVEAILTSLFPRYYEKNELIFEQDDSFKEALFILKGNYKLGFFDFIDVNDPYKNWYQFEFNKNLHDPAKTHCKNLILGGYCMFYKKRSDIAYMSTEPIMGYALMRKDWFKKEPGILYELSNSFRRTAMRKYYQHWIHLKSKHFPMYIKWYRNDDGKPELGVNVIG